MRQQYFYLFLLVQSLLGFHSFHIPTSLQAERPLSVKNSLLGSTGQVNQLASIHHLCLETAQYVRSLCYLHGKRLHREQNH